MPTPTALITGASSGIGRALAHRFAADDHRLILVARRAELLHALAAELKSLHAAEVHVLVADLSVAGSAQALWDQVEALGLPVDVLVNNAGFGIHDQFVDVPMARWTQMVQLNVTTLMELTHLALPAMRARRFGRIVNLSSVGGLIPAPSFAVYAATKSFVLFFSEALREEVAAEGITVTAVCPGATNTEFHEAAGHRDTLLMHFMGSVDAMADETYRAIKAGTGMLLPGLVNKPVSFLLRFVPRAWAPKLAGRLSRKA
ncbi:MAG: SDR family oxidoreductase [Rubrivivax sp.]|nr:MAG: SDR family oxidoreductase [Rubrivivax sp.]